MDITEKKGRILKYIKVKIWEKELNGGSNQSYKKKHKGWGQKPMKNEFEEESLVNGSEKEIIGFGTPKISGTLELFCYEGETERQISIKQREFSG